MRWKNNIKEINVDKQNRNRRKPTRNKQVDLPERNIGRSTTNKYRQIYHKYIKVSLPQINKGRSTRKK